MTIPASSIHYQSVPNSIKAEIVARYWSRGESQAFLAQQYGVAQTSVSRWVREAVLLDIHGDAQ